MYNNERRTHLQGEKSTALHRRRAVHTNAAKQQDGVVSTDEAMFTAPTASVLIVDDIATNLKVAEGLMQPYKMQIDMCTSGREAIQFAQNNKYDLVLMDQMMPEMDGIEAAGIIRSLDDGSGYYAHLPIVALTANTVMGAKDLFLRSNFSDYLSKPLDKSKINAVLKKWIPRQKQEGYVEDEKSQEIIPFVIEGLDVKYGMSLTGDSIDTYLRTLAVFHRDGLMKINEIKACLADNDIKLYTTYVHALKSAAFSVGSKRISYLAAALETAGRNEDIIFIESNNGNFIKELEKLLNNIEDVIVSRRTDGESADVKADAEQLRLELIKLKNALNNFEAGQTEETLNKLTKMCRRSVELDALEKISMNILLFEYDDAISIIDELIIDLS